MDRVKIRNYIWKVGFDVEVFLMDLGGRMVTSSEAKIKGTKKTPNLINVVGHPAIEKIKIPSHKDNVLFEFQTNPYIFLDGRGHETYIHFTSSFNQEAKIVKNYLYSKKLSPVTIPTHEFDISRISKHKINLHSGCDIDYSPYVTKSAVDISDTHKRFAGLHIHLSAHHIKTGEVLKIEYDRMVGLMDLLIGVRLEYIADIEQTGHKELSVERRKYYGQAGSYRVKPYGLEYRVMSPSLAPGLYLSHSFNYVLHNLIKHYCDGKSVPSDILSAAIEFIDHKTDESLKYFQQHKFIAA